MSTTRACRAIWLVAQLCTAYSTPYRDGKLFAQGKYLALHGSQGPGKAILVAASLLVLADFSADQAFDLLSCVRERETGYRISTRSLFIATSLQAFHQIYSG